jgi:hypothetical protein
MDEGDMESLQIVVDVEGPVRSDKIFARTGSVQEELVQWKPTHSIFERIENGVEGNFRVYRSEQEF